MQVLKLFVVDDDPSAVMSAEFHLEDERCQISAFKHGEACLQAMDQSPDVILMDVEMPGMGGIPACRAIRESGNERTQIIFVSSHDKLEMRLAAYDAGATDYIVKPYAPEELKQKVIVARRILQTHKDLSHNAQCAQQTAFSAMSSMGELGAALAFLRASFSCQTYDDLALRLLASIKSYGLQGMLEIRVQKQFFRRSSQGVCTPLEISTLRQASELERIFQLGGWMAVNYPHITLIVSNLPLENPDRIGRLRDYLASITEGADARILTIDSENRRLSQSNGIVHAVAEMSDALKEIERRQQDHRLLALTVMNEFITEIEGECLRMRLLEKNEKTLTGMAHKIRDRICQMMDEAKGLGDNLTGIVARLKAISEK